MTVHRAKKLKAGAGPEPTAETRPSDPEHGEVHIARPDADHDRNGYVDAEYYSKAFPWTQKDRSKWLPAMKHVATGAVSLRLGDATHLMLEVRGGNVQPFDATKCKSRARARARARPLSERRGLL